MAGGMLGQSRDDHPPAELTSEGWFLKWALLDKVGLGTDGSGGKLEDVRLPRLNRKCTKLGKKSSSWGRQLRHEEPYFSADFTNLKPCLVAGLQQYVIVTLAFAVSLGTGKVGVVDVLTRGSNQV